MRDITKLGSEIITGIFYGVLGIGIAVGIVIIVLMFGSQIIDTVYYGWLGQERPTMIAVGQMPTISHEDRIKQMNQARELRYMVRALGLNQPYPSFEEVQARYELMMSDLISGVTNQTVAFSTVLENGDLFWMVKQNNGTITKFFGTYKELKGNFTLDRVVLP